MPAVTTATILGAGLATQAGVAAGASLGTSFFTAGLVGGAVSGYGMSQTNIGKKSIGIAEDFGHSVKDIFSPDLPELPPTPDPVAQQSTLAATQAEERSLINRAGLAGTKKVRSLLGKTDSLGGGGSGV